MRNNNISVEEKPTVNQGSTKVVYFSKVLNEQMIAKSWSYCLENYFTCTNPVP